MTSLKKNRLLFVVLTLAVFVSSFSLEKGQTLKGRDRNLMLSRRELRFSGERPDSRFQGQRYAPGQVLLKFRPGLGESLLEATFKAYGMKEVERIPNLDIYKAKIPSALSVEEMVSALGQNPDIEYAEPNYIGHIAVTPNDPLYRFQWALANTGQEIGTGGPKGTSGADIKAPAAWEETEGNSNVVIAIVDTGVDTLHPDLKNKIKSAGKDFVNNDNDATDDNGHGTLVAGIAAADTNNDTGIAGIAWNAKILPVKVIDKEGSGYYDWIVNGIRWAVDNGASVINLSLGGEDAADSLRDAVKYAHDKGVVVAAAAGNNGTAVVYPAAYDAFVLAVAATDYNDARAAFSNPGPEVDVAAPGVRVAGPVPTWFWAANGGSASDSPYAFADGTSAATPHVAGLAALIKGLKSGLSTDDIMDIIRYSADDVNAAQHKGKDDYIGYGRINMSKALVPIKITR